MSIAGNQRFTGGTNAGQTGRQIETAL